MNKINCSIRIYDNCFKSDGDTIVIKGVTLTLKKTLGSAAGNVLIGATGANLATLITNPGIKTSNCVALAEADRALLRGITATYNATTNILSITSM